MTGDTIIDYYNNNALNFIEGTVNVDTGPLRERFLKYIPDGGNVLDLGCGSGRDSKCFKEAGYQVSAIDASQEFCGILQKNMQPLYDSARRQGYELWQY